MAEFQKRLFLFSFILFGSLVIIFFLTTMLIEEKTNYSVSKNTDKLVIGHSHTACSYNDKLIKNFINTSSGGTSYFYNYYALQPLIRHNSQIKTVFIEFTNNQIKPVMDDWTWGDEYISHKFQIFGHYIDNEGIMFLLKKNVSGIINGYLKLLKQNFKIIVKSHYGYLYDRGGYLYIERNKVKEDIIRQNKLQKNNVRNTILSKTNLLYLEKSISFCKSKNIKVYLIRSPMHQKYFDFFTEDRFQELVHTKFKDVEFIDLKNYPLTDADYGDLEHLNYKGAKKFSIWFNSLLENGLLNQKNKQEFIDLKMKSELRRNKRSEKV